MNPLMWAKDRLTLVRILILLEFVSILVSTSAAIIIEVMIYLLIISSKTLLKRIYSIRNEPIIIMTFVWGIILLASCLYSIAPREDLMEILVSWRKLLLIPICAAFFNDPGWKKRAVYTFFTTLCILLSISSLMWVLDIGFYKYQDGIIIANHAAQGMCFSVCILLGLVLARRQGEPFRNKLLCYSGAALAFLNIVFITPGRSGYLAMISLISLYVLYIISGTKKYVVFLLMTVALAGTLNFSATARNRILQGIDEIKSYETSPELTSMGIRIIVWKKSLKLLKERPVWGYGTGAFVQAYKTTVSGEPGWQNQVIGDPHNQFLRILIEHGGVGLFFFLLLIGSFFVQPVGGTWRFLGLSVLITWCATSLFSSHFTTFLEGRFLMIWLGIFLSKTADRDNRIGEKP